jgi:hypothetical protein
MPEKVADDLHRYALIQEMLSGGVPKGMWTASTGDNANSGKAITDDLAEGFAAKRSYRGV